MLQHEAYIASTANPRVKKWAKLQERKYREREGKFLLEGVHLVKEALQAGWPLECVVYDAGRGVPQELAAWAKGERAEEATVAWIPASPEVIARCSETQSPQPVFAVAKKRNWRLTDVAPTPAASPLFDRASALVAVLDGVQDPGNVGTIVRSAAACGATAVVLGRGTADMYNAKTLRAAMGALFSVPVIEAELTDLLPQAQQHGLAVVGTSLAATRSCYSYNFRRGVWLVFGNEGSGLSPAVSACVSEHIIIPMTGRAESLNVAMAATVLLFEAQRQRMV